MRGAAADLSAARSEPRLSDAVFARFQELIRRESGIWLSPAKKALLLGRLARRLRERGLSSYGDYLELVRREEGERVRMLDCVSTNETHFFREPRHFDYLARSACPGWRAEAAAGRRARRLRVWSAACSTGEEPYSIAMSLLQAFPQGSGWELEIFASDISTRVLEKARSALWPIAKAKEIPPLLLNTFMLRGTGSQQGLMKAGPEIRALVRFARLNLNDGFYGAPGLFDAIFCRNVLIYFDPPTKQAVVRRLLGHLAPGGHFFLGHAESLGNLPGLCTVMPTVYTRPP